MKLPGAGIAYIAGGDGALPGGAGAGAGADGGDGGNTLAVTIAVAIAFAAAAGKALALSGDFAFVIAAVVACGQPLFVAGLIAGIVTGLLAGVEADDTGEEGDAEEQRKGAGEKIARGKFLFHPVQLAAERIAGAAGSIELHLQRFVLGFQLLFPFGEGIGLFVVAARYVLQA